MFHSSFVFTFQRLVFQSCRKYSCQYLYFTVANLSYIRYLILYLKLPALLQVTFFSLAKLNYVFIIPMFIAKFVSDGVESYVIFTFRAMLNLICLLSYLPFEFPDRLVGSSTIPISSRIFVDTRFTVN